VLKHGSRLVENDPQKPFNELVDRCTVFEVLEECRCRHARAAKQPSATVALGVVFDNVTGRPINYSRRTALGGISMWARYLAAHTHREREKTSPKQKRMPKMSLLCLASHSGK
jgi:hypothetical protein